ncbi:MAG: hypothetical protein Kow0022_18730 [Phycisphaerales bacterium]
MRRSTHGFTLIEAVVATVILSVVAAAVLPVVTGATETLSDASQVERIVDESCYAMDRIVRVLREAPPGTDPGTIGITSLGASQVIFSDGSGCRVKGGVLQIRFTDGVWGDLCDQVDAFEIRARDASGADSSDVPQQTQRFEVGLVRGGFELRAVAFCRARYGT